MKKHMLPLILILITLAKGFSQSGKPPRILSEHIQSDSTTFLFPVRYNEFLNSDTKITLSGEYYSNIIFYDVATDTHKPLFKDDTFIEGLISRNHYSSSSNSQGYTNIRSGCILLLVKEKDSNNNGRIDSSDASSLYLTSTNGSKLLRMTTDLENVLSFEVVEKPGIVFIKIQFDSNHDGDFRKEDRRTYYRKLNLVRWELGQPIEYSQTTP